jgi:hypothetical protein
MQSIARRRAEEVQADGVPRLPRLPPPFHGEAAMMLLRAILHHISIRQPRRSARNALFVAYRRSATPSSPRSLCLPPLPLLEGECRPRRRRRHVLHAARYAKDFAAHLICPMFAAAAASVPA